MKLFLLTVLKNSGAAFLTEKMAIWGARMAASFTTNKIDDNVVNLIAAASANDPEGMRKAIEAIANEIKTKDGQGV